MASRNKLASTCWIERVSCLSALFPMPPQRASARKRPKQEEEGGKAQDEPTQPPKPSKRGIIGKLAALTQMPLDILFEVCSL